MAKHARFSPSKLESLEQCPCFEYKQMVTKEDEESPAERGTRLHSLVETGESQYVREPEDKELHQKVKDLLEGFRAKYGPDEEVEELTEVKVMLEDLTYGTVDKLLLFPKLNKAIVIDWKFIRNKSVSEPDTNLQLQCYTGGTLEEYPEIEEVEAYIAAPQIDWLPDPCTYTRDSLPAIRSRVEEIILKCADPFKKPTPCDLCPNCDNAARCPAMGNVAVAVVNGIGLPTPASFAPDSLATPDDKAKGMIVAKALENWSDQVKKNINAWVREGNTLPGHSTITRKGNPKIVDVEAAVVAMRSKLDDSQILGSMSMSLTKITKAIAEKEGKDKARDTVESLLTGLLERGPDVVYVKRKKGDDTL